VRERRPRTLGIAIEQAAAVERLVEPLVGIDRDRVRPVEAAKRLGNGQGGERAVGAVDVEPNAVLLRDRRTKASSGSMLPVLTVPRRGDHGERPLPRGDVVTDRSIEGLGHHPERRIDGDGPYASYPRPRSAEALGIDM
jgi:hypothetical protein